MISRAHSNESRIFPPVGGRNPFIQAELVDVPKVWGLKSIAVVGSWRTEMFCHFETGLHSRHVRRNHFAYDLVAPRSCWQTQNGFSPQLPLNHVEYYSHSEPFRLKKVQTVVCFMRKRAQKCWLEHPKTGNARHVGTANQSQPLRLMHSKSVSLLHCWDKSLMLRSSDIVNKQTTLTDLFHTACSQTAEVLSSRSCRAQVVPFQTCSFLSFRQVSCCWSVTCWLGPYPIGQCTLKKDGFYTVRWKFCRILHDFENTFQHIAIFCQKNLLPIAISLRSVHRPSKKRRNEYDQPSTFQWKQYISTSRWS